MTTTQQRLDSGFGAQSTTSDVLGGIDLTGRTALVTGGYSGSRAGDHTRARSHRSPGHRSGTKARRSAGDAERPSRHRGARTGLGANWRAFEHSAARFLEAGRTLDIVIANAGIMACPETRVGPGWEAQFAVNHLGHYALVNLLWPAIADGGARVVAVSSGAHHITDIRWDDIHFRTSYERWTAYGQAKTANVLFAVGLDARGRRSGVRAFATHPGSILTPLQRHLPRQEMVDAGWIDEDGNGRRPVVQDARTGCRDTSLGRHLTTTRRPGRRLLRGLRHRPDRRRLGHGAWRRAAIRDRRRCGRPAVGRVSRHDRHRRLPAQLTKKTEGRAKTARAGADKSESGHLDVPATLRANAHLS